MTDEELYCMGCGIKIQTTDEQLPGYTPVSALEREPLLCRRCFRLKHYNEIEDVPFNAADFAALLSQVADADALVVAIIDIFDVAGSWISELPRLIGKNPVLLVGNKVDLLPKSTNMTKLKMWLQRSAKGMGIHPLDVQLMSAEKNIGIDEVRERIEQLRNGRDVYIVGATNVGKSTFINHLIRSVGASSLITTSRFPGTTLDFIGIPLADGKMLYDTPGLINPEQAIHFFDPSDYKKIIPSKEIKPKVYQLNERQSLFLGGIGRVDYEGPGRRSLIVYAAPGLTIHRTKQERANELYDRQYGRLLSPPSLVSEPPVLVRHDFRTKDADSDIVFAGLGWVSVKGHGARLSAYAPRAVGVSIRSSIIKG
ncbi:MAG: ribosome biogenesis GTPase YqeH [Sporolactobacillus sp.]